MSMARRRAEGSWCRGLQYGIGAAAGVTAEARGSAGAPDLAGALATSSGSGASSRTPFRAEKRSGARSSGRYWARTSDPQLVELVLSQLS